MVQTTVNDHILFFYQKKIILLYYTGLHKGIFMQVYNTLRAYSSIPAILFFFTPSPSVIIYFSLCLCIGVWIRVQVHMCAHV